MIAFRATRENGTIYNRMPHWFADLPDEIGQEEPKERGDFEKAARMVFTRDRKRPKWKPHSRGKPIQQYYTADFMQELEKLRQQLFEKIFG